MQKTHVIFLMAAALLPFTTWATEQTDNSDPIIVDSLATIVEETEQAINVADPVPACVPVSDNGTSIVSEPPVADQLSGRELSLDADLYRHYNGPDFRFLKNMVDIISQSHRNLFPVTDDEGTLLGVVLLDDIRNIMFRPDLYRRVNVDRFMATPPAKVIVGTPMEKVMKTFDETGAWNLPVIDEEGKYVGFVSKSKIFNSYRQVLKHYTYD